MSVRADRRLRAAVRRRLRVLICASAVVLLVAVIAAVNRSGPPAPPPEAQALHLSAGADPLAYSSGRQRQFVARATAGLAQPLFTQSPGGALATAARVARWRGLIDQVTRGTDIDPALLEGIVFVESAGRPLAVAGHDPSAAAGLTQILASTAVSLLGMHVDTVTDARVLAQLAGGTSSARAGQLVALLQRDDQRFDPRQALAATVRYLRLAQARLGRADLAIVSYHMGLGNIQNVLDAYDGGRAVPYAQLYFDTAPDRHPAAYRLLAGFGDQSSLYLWRVLGAVQIMRLYREDRSALTRLASLQTAWDSTAAVLHPFDTTPAFGDPHALSDAYRNRELIPLPTNAHQLGLGYAPAIGDAARSLGAPPALYRGLRPAAVELLALLGTRVRALSGSRSVLRVDGAVEDRRYQTQVGDQDPPAATGYTFTLDRSYSSPAQAQALQAMLDRLQALNLIGWSRRAQTIEITVASDAGHVISSGV